MKKLFGFLFLICVSTSMAFAQVIPYPRIPGLATSAIYQVKVNGQEIWTEAFTTNFDLASMPEWFSAPYVSEQQEVHIANFGASGPLEVEITVAAGIENAKVKPLSRNISVKQNNRSLTFSLPGPDKLYIEINDLPPLCLLANPPEADVPDKYAPGVHYFGPGVHYGGYIYLQDNETLYLAPGAVVYGGVRAQNVKNIKIKGRGILDANFEFTRQLLIENSTNISVEGVILRHSRSWTNTLVNCDTITYDNVKVFGFGPSSDGINPMNSRQVEIRNCFLRCTDDCVAIKAADPRYPVRNINVEDNTMIGFAYSDGVTIGFETNAPEVSNITVRNCDVILARGGSRVDGHSGFSIICDGPATIHDVLFEDIRVEQSEIKLFELNVTNGTLYGDDPPGNIRDITLRNINWLHRGPIVLYGFDQDHMVRNVLFENCEVAGIPLRKIQQEILEKNKFVENIKVKK